jgi:hypothetical protein
VNSARAFLNGIVDYAGLFPPASLDMRSAVRSFDDYRKGADRDLLGRFVVAAPRLAELSSAAEDIFPREGEPWLISAIAGSDPDHAIASVLGFNERHSGRADRGLAVCDTIEMPVSSRREVESAARTFAGVLKLFLEVPGGSDARELFSSIAQAGAAAKIRTGGVIESAIPPSTVIRDFMRCCIDADIAFKATAGLHHAVRGVYRLTYEPDSPRATMHGYVNVFLAAAFCARGSDGTALSVLEETDASAFRFDASGAWWRNELVDSRDLERTREHVALSFGSCSFTEPVTEARQLHLL